jgi:hypothetical protein
MRALVLLIPLGVSACSGKSGGDRGQHSGSDDSTASSGESDADHDGWPDDEDCDDDDAEVHPDAVERCDGIDNNCAEGVDEPSAAEASLWFQDGDGDGYGVPGSGEMACASISGRVDNDEDCDDLSAEAHPGLTERCGDGVDNDCDGTDNGCGLDSENDVDNADAVVSESSEQPPGVTHFVGWVGDVTGDGADDLMVHWEEIEATKDEPGHYDLLAGPFIDSDTMTPAATIDKAETNNPYTVVHPAGDLNQDGEADLLLASQDQAGVLYGPISGTYDFTSDTDVRFPLTRGYTSATAVGDVDADGYGDLAYSRATETVDGMLSAGSVWLVRGPIVAEGPSVSEPWAGEAEQQLAGSTLASLGDVDGDGLDDIGIGAEGDATLAPEAGAAFVLLGPAEASGSLGDADWKLLGEPTGAHYGSLCGAGDLDQDGLADLQVGSTADWWNDDGQVTPPLYVVQGATEPHGVALLSDVADVTFYASKGEEVDLGGPTGDFDGDDVLDLTLTGVAFRYNSTGRGFLFLGPVSGTRSVDSADATFDAPANQWLMYSSLGGDANGDGIADLVYTNYTDNVSIVDGVFIFFGGITW